ncbi:GCN5-like N-acetyltransferase [Mesorhizobium prunaredense]|uniref:GCN5-like N-acetyltransferase n=2 Tax=Mesorhizobium prunaredense TaxID=1631249 RepID=A0A1R3V505_9HYPH|nr:GCN5-like N-acetyltransferase [Mesorhizobium prunaredense]
MNGENISIRRATEQDHPAIRGLVRGERLNPTDLMWPNFLVAAADGHIVGAIQMRKHADGSRELGSLVVSKESRGQGVATRLIYAVLATESGPVWMITANAFAGAYSRWGFRRIEPRTAPVRIRRNHRMGSLASIVSFFKRRPIRRLVILERLPSMK